MDPSIRDSESNPKPFSENKDDASVVFIDTNLDTHLAVLVSDHDTVSDLKERILLEHPSCFPKLGQIQIHAMKVKRKEYFYNLSDSMVVKSVFYGFNKSWFLSVDASSLGEHGQNDRSSGSPNKQVLLGNSDNALIGLINDEKEEHDFVSPSDKVVKDDNIVCEDGMLKFVSSAKEKQKSTRKGDDTGTESMKEASEPARATNKPKKRRKRKDVDLDERTTRKEECTPSKQNKEDANVKLNVTSKVVVLGISAIEKSEKRRKTRKDKDSDVGTTVGEGIGPTVASDSKIVIVKSLKSADCNSASGDIGAEENLLNHTEVENIQQAEMKGTVVSATEKDDAASADNPDFLEQIETIANAEHVDKTRRKKSNKKQSTKLKSSSNMLTNDVNDS